MRVTDHAVIRFLERVLGWDFSEYAPGMADHEVVRQLETDGIDIEAVRATILTETVMLAGRLGATKVHRHDSTVVLEDSRVITILPKEARRR